MAFWSVFNHVMTLEEKNLTFPHLAPADWDPIIPLTSPRNGEKRYYPTEFPGELF